MRIGTCFRCRHRLLYLCVTFHDNEGCSYVLINRQQYFSGNIIAQILTSLVESYYSHYFDPLCYFYFVVYCIVYMSFGLRFLT